MCVVDKEKMNKKLKHIATVLRIASNFQLIYRPMISNKYCIWKTNTKMSCDGTKVQQKGLFKKKFMYTY